MQTCAVDAMYNQAQSDNTSYKIGNTLCNSINSDKLCECRQCEKAFAHIELCCINMNSDICDVCTLSNVFY